MTDPDTNPQPKTDPTDPGGPVEPLPAADGAPAADRISLIEPVPMGRELTMQTPVADLSGRELTMTPSPVLSGRELTMTPVADLSGRELTMTPAPILSGRELTMTPVADLSGRELTMTPQPGVDGRELTLQTPATGIDGRELTIQGAATPTPATVGGRPRTDPSLAGFKPRTGVGTSIAFDDAWHLQGRKGPHTGQTWGDFELGGILGEGGMGAVYRGKQRSLRRRVAIKVLPPSLSADARLLQRFQLEATTTSKLQTPHVVQVYSIGEFDGNHFYAMEYVEGKDLYDIIKERREQNKPLTPDEACAYILQAAKGLAEAGRHQIVHRDIKPPNMMVTKDGMLKIADFGIVKVMGEHNLTMTGQAVGTPAYVSPEQGRGDREVDCRSDLYSLGVVFYELVCDRKPFDGSTPNALIYQHCYEEPKLPREYNAAVSDEIQAVIMRCLQKKAENRYQSADDLVRDLEAIRTGSMLKSAIANYKLGTGADEAKREQMTWLQRNMMKVAAAGLLVIGGGVGGGWYYYDQIQQEKRARDRDELVGQRAALDQRKALQEQLDVIKAIPEGVVAQIDNLVSLIKDGEQDADVLRWRRKLAEVEALNLKLAPLATAQPSPGLRTAARSDLDALIAKVGADDPAAARYAAKLKDFDDEEARLRSESARFDAMALKLSDRKRYGDLLTDLGQLVPAADPQLTKWTSKVATWDQELAALRGKIAPLDAEERVTVARRAQYLPVLTDLSVYLDKEDKDLARWQGKLEQAGSRVADLRRDIGVMIGEQPDTISKPKQDQAATKLDQYESLVGAEDPQLKDWKGAIIAAERAITGGRERLARFASDSGDGLLSAGVHTAFERELKALEALVYPGDAEVQKWQGQLADSRRTIEDLRRDGAVLDPSATVGVTLAAQRDLTPKVERAAAKGAVDAARAQLWRDRLAAEAKRVSELRARLAPFDQAESLTDSMRTDLARLTTDAGGDDADVRRWTGKRDRVDALVAKLSALDSRQGVPDDVGALFAELGRLVGEKDPRLVAWKGKVQRIEAARSELAILDRRASFDATETATRLIELADLVGGADRRLVAWKVKATEVATLKAELARLPGILAQSPAEHAASHSRLRRLAAKLVGPDDAAVRTAAARQDELDGPPRPSWAAAAGRDSFGLWAEAEVPGGSLRLRYVASGMVTVGSPDGEAGREPDELPVALILPRGFWLSESELPRAVYAATTGRDPSLGAGDPAITPASRMTWNEARTCCASLAERLPGFTARLPLEVEWEHACRAGTAHPWNLPADSAADVVGVGKVAWHAGNAGGMVQPVRARLPNLLGLYDLHGNLAEWCEDAYAAYPTSTQAISGPATGGERKVVRGGSWGDEWLRTRAANRIPVRPEARSAYVGMRVAVAADWTGRTPDGSGVLTAALSGSDGTAIEFGVGTWRFKLANEGK